MSSCAMCEKRGKHWDGHDPVCAFIPNGSFDDNWNCATLGGIRDICYEGNDHVHGVEYQYCDDYKYATIFTDFVDDVDAQALWACWYKNRGRTDAMWLLSNDRKPRIPTEAECVAIIQAYARQP